MGLSMYVGKPPKSKKDEKEEYERIGITLTLPKEWIPKIKEYMRKKGYINYAELVRELIRRVIIEGDVNEVK